MQVEITPRNYHLDEPVRDKIEERAEKFRRYAQDLQQARFTLTAEKIEMICDIQIHLRGRDFHSSSKDDNMLSAVDGACASMDKQLRRFKRRVTDHKARFEKPGMTSAAALEADVAALKEEPEDLES